MKSAATNAWHHRTAVFVAFATLVVIVAGVLITSEGSGLSVPDWPTSYSHLLKLPPWVGGIVYEHNHRMIAWFTGMCTWAAS
jgi:cytochrome c oxidase assembly protein subunit 15